MTWRVRSKSDFGAADRQQSDAANSRQWRRVPLARAFHTRSAAGRLFLTALVAGRGDMFGLVLFS